MRWTAIVNPSAGRGRTRRLLPDLRDALETRGIALHVSTDAEDARTAARDACRRGDGVIVCGGDGTVAALAGIVAEEHSTLAVVPTGAGNDFARDLGVDRSAPLAALDVLDGGHAATIDLARATTDDGASRWCTTVANTGFDAEANRWANGVHLMTGRPLYVLAMLRTVAVYRPQPVIVRVDDEEWRDRAWLVAAGNTRYYAGGMMITPDAEIDDGLLDVCIIGPGSVGKFTSHFPQVFNGTHVDIDEVVMLRGRTVDLEADGGDVPLELWASGERVGPLPGRVEVVPGALRVLVPPGARTS